MNRQQAEHILDAYVRMRMRESDKDASDALREYGHDCCARIDDAIHDYCDEIEREIAERYMELPVDADGVPIKPRDNVDTGMGDKGPVGHLEYWYPNSWVAVIEYKPGQFTRYDPLAIRHVKPRTVEDVLRDCCNEWNQHCGEDWEQGVYAKYAAELRMRDGDDR